MWRFFKGLFYRYPALRSEIDALASRLEYDEKPDRKSSLELIYSWTGEIEGRCGTYLGHISIMIAVAGIFSFGPSVSAGVKLALGFELIAYLGLALLCIRCQLHVGVTAYVGLKPKSVNWTPKKSTPGTSIAELGMTEEERAEYYRTEQTRVVERDDQFDTLLKSEFIFREKLSKIIIISLFILTFLLIFLVAQVFGLLGAIINLATCITEIFTQEMHAEPSSYNIVT